MVVLMVGMYLVISSANLPLIETPVAQQQPEKVELTKEQKIARAIALQKEATAILESI